MRPETSIDVVQTTGILFMGLLLAYVVVRLERALNAGAEKLKSVGAHHQATLDSLNKLWARINEIEVRVGVRKPDYVPTHELCLTLAALSARIEALEHETASLDH